LNDDLESDAVLVRAEEKKDRQGSGDNAYDDIDHSGACKARSFLRRLDGGFHAELDAAQGSGGCIFSGPGEEISHSGGDLLDVSSEGKVSGVKELNGHVGVIAR
jgi:hypothetical protein